MYRPSGRTSRVDVVQGPMHYKEQGQLWQSFLPKIEDLEFVPEPLIVINLSHSMPRYELLNPGMTEMDIILRLPEKRSKVKGVFEYWITDDKNGVLSNEELISLSRSIIAFLETKINVVVNCSAGVSRSSYIVLATLMMWYHWTYREALEHLKTVRYEISPNPAFKNHLIAMEKRLIW